MPMRRPSGNFIILLAACMLNYYICLLRNYCKFGKIFIFILIIFGIYQFVLEIGNYDNDEGKIEIIRNMFECTSYT